MLFDDLTCLEIEFQGQQLKKAKYELEPLEHTTSENQIDGDLWFLGDKESIQT